MYHLQYQNQTLIFQYIFHENAYNRVFVLIANHEFQHHVLLG